MPADTTIAATDGLLVLKECPRCGYALIGLPLQGTCPECGHAYQQGTVILDGWGRGSQASAATAPPRLLMLIAVASSCMLFIVASVFSQALWFGRSIWGLVVLVSLMPVAEASLQLFFGSSREPPIQLRLNAVGSSQTTRSRRSSDDADPSDAILQRVPGWIVAGAFLYWFARRLNVQTVALGVGLIVVGKAGEWIRLRRRMRKLQNEPPLLTLAFFPENGFIEPPTPWREVSRVRMKCRRKGRCRLRISQGKWWNRQEPIDFEFIATADDAAELERRIQSWRAAAIERASGRSMSQGSAA